MGHMNPVLCHVVALPLALLMAGFAAAAVALPLFVLAMIFYGTWEGLCKWASAMGWWRTVALAGCQIVMVIAAGVGGCVILFAAMNHSAACLRDVAIMHGWTWLAESIRAPK